MSERDARRPRDRQGGGHARWYRLALRVFPERIRTVHGAEMEEMFADAWAVARRAGGVALARLALRTIKDVTFNGLAARFQRGGGGMRRLADDVVGALRGLARRPGFALVAILTLGLGIGGNTAIYSIVDAAYIDALPYPHGDRIVVPYNTPRPDQGIGFAAFSAPFHAALRDEGVFDAIAAIVPYAVNIGGSDRPERIPASGVSASFFDVAGVEPAKGRVFTAEEDRPGGAAVAVVSDGLWRGRFASDPALVGREIVVDGRPTTIVGVMPPDFGLLVPDVQVWLPLRVDEGSFDDASAVNNDRLLVARLPAGATIASAADRLPSAVDRLRARFPDAVSEGQAVTLRSLRRHLYGSARANLLILLGAVALVLLIACANLANLLMVRAEERRAELAIRAALGAGRVRLVQALVVESFVLAALGGVAGLFLASWGLAWIRPLAPAGIPLPTHAALDPSVLGFTAGVAFLTGLLFGLVPAGSAMRTDLRGALVAGGRGGASGRRTRARSVLVAAEVAITVVLLVGSGLLLNSLWRLQSVDPGFDPEDRTAADLDLPRATYPEGTMAALFYQRLLERVEASPDVIAAGLSQFLPLAGSVNWGYQVEDREDSAIGVADYTLITPGYLDAMGMSVVEGRGLTWADAEPGAPPVLLVSRTMARRLWPDGTPIGRRININLRNPVWREVVGVVSDVRNRSLATEPSDLMYFPPVDLPMANPRGMSLVVHHRAAAPPTSELRRTVAELDATLPLTQVRALRSIARTSEQRRLFMLMLMGLFAGLALTLAAVGLYGVVSYTCSLRTREIGLRMAVGADRGSVLGLVMGQSAFVIGAGLAAGLAGAAALTRFLGALLYDVPSIDLVTYAAVALFLTTVAMVASWVPARRASALDPASVLRG